MSLTALFVNRTEPRYRRFSQTGKLDVPRRQLAKVLGNPWAALWVDAPFSLHHAASSSRLSAEGQ